MIRSIPARSPAYFLAMAAWLDARFDAGQGTCPWAAGLVTLIPTVFIVRTLKFWRFVCPVDPSGAAKLGHRTKRRAVGLLG